MAIAYTKKMMVERLQRHVANNFPSDDSSLTDNLVLLYIDQALAANIVGQVFGLAKLEGNIAMPEAYVSTWNISDLAQNPNTGDWYGTLPQPPISLPLGVSVTDIYFAQTAYGKAQPVFMIKNKRVSLRRFMPLPSGVRAWIEGQTIFLVAHDGSSLQGQNLYVKMAKSRTTDVNEPMLLPDDAIDAIFNSVVKQIVQRFAMPEDTIKDVLPAGAKTS